MTMALAQLISHIAQLKNAQVISLFNVKTVSVYPIRISVICKMVVHLINQLNVLMDYVYKILLYVPIIIQQIVLIVVISYVQMAHVYKIKTNAHWSMDVPKKLQSNVPQVCVSIHKRQIVQ